MHTSTEEVFDQNVYTYKQGWGQNQGEVAPHPPIQMEYLPCFVKMQTILDAKFDIFTSKF